jgi:16S rRNA (cytosine967-C5)-methyltransferase
MKVEHQIKAFEQLLEQYDGSMPLHRFLVTYFKKNKQMGSSDRRWVSRYIYSFFRIGRALRKESTILRLAIADFLCNVTPSLIIEKHFPALLDQLSLPAPAKIKLIQDLFPGFVMEDIFDFKTPLSADVDKEAYLNSYFIQPDLFIRVDERQAASMLDTLKLEGIPVRDISASTMALPNGTKLENFFPNQQYYQVQDLSSQKTGAFFQPKAHEYWWDCCAASGGKSLLLHQIEPKVQLLVSDIRENSLHNLEERFHEVGLKKYQKKVLDLLKNNDQDLHDYAFDGIILDAPCSGSGTWGRTPEMLSYFEEFKVDFYVRLQRNIAANVVKYLKPGKPLIYITCSVFAEENEEVVNFIQEELSMELEKMEMIKGYHDKADTMFVARLIKK